MRDLTTLPEPDDGDLLSDTGTPAADLLAPALAVIVCVVGMALLIVAATCSGRAHGKALTHAQALAIATQARADLDVQGARLVAMDLEVGLLQAIAIHYDPVTALGLNDAPNHSGSTRGAGVGPRPASAPVTGRNLESTSDRDLGARLETVHPSPFDRVNVDSTPGALLDGERRASLRGARGVQPVPYAGVAGSTPAPAIRGAR